MVQAKLPDLNNYWIKYHDIGIHSLFNKDYASCVASIYNMNALLPDDYRVEINTEQYNELAKKLRNIKIRLAWIIHGPPWEPTAIGTNEQIMYEDDFVVVSTPDVDQFE